MGNLKLQHHDVYYNNPDKFGNYQFVSLFDVIDQFMVAYVGDEKIINKVSRTDVAFFAQRALAELSFDTFKSFKSQQIDVPSNLTMILPHDYVNYTKMSWTDSSGIKHPLYLTTDTSNPFQVRQHTDGTYDFPEQYELLLDNSFDDDTWVESWEKTYFIGTPSGAATGDILGGPNTNTGLLHKQSGTQPNAQYVYHSAADFDGTLTFVHGSRTSHHLDSNTHGTAQAVWQKIDVSDIDFITLTANAETSAAVSGTQDTSTTASGNEVVNAAGQTISSKPYWEVDTNNYYASDNAATRQTFVLTVTGTWAADDTFEFDGKTITATGSSVTDMASAIKSGGYPNWNTHVVGAAVTFTAKVIVATSENVVGSATYVSGITVTTAASDVAYTTTSGVVGNPQPGGVPGFGVLATGNTQAVTIPATTVRVGISSKPGAVNSTMSDYHNDTTPSPNQYTDIFDIDYLEWTAGDKGSRELTSIDVRSYSEVYVIGVSIVPWGTDTHGQKYGSHSSSGNKALWVRTTLDDISVKDMGSANYIQSALGNFDKSSTWRNYKSTTPSENNNDDYEDDTYWPCLLYTSPSPRDS